MISRRWLINYVLILLIVVFTFIGNRFNVQTGYQPENSISTLKPQDIKQVRIQTADETIQLSKTEGSWLIESPVLWQANNIAVERIIGIVNAETDSRLPSDEIDLSTLGLQIPTAVLTLNQSQFLFGATNNIGERRYLQNNDTVFLLEDRYLPLLAQGIPGLIDRRLLPRALPLARLKIGSTVFDKNADEIIKHWQTLEAAQVKPYQPGQTPMQKIIAVLDNGGEIEFYQMAITPKIILARPDLGLQYYFHESHYYGLLAAPKDETTAN